MPDHPNCLHGWLLPSFVDHGLNAPSSQACSSTLSLDYWVTRSDDSGSFECGFGDLAAFRVSFGEEAIELIRTSVPDEPATLNHLLYDHLVPRVVSASGKLVLHGSVVRIGSALAVFLGETGAGKSTLAASLDAKGYELLGDDAVVVAPIDGVFHGEPVYRSLRLYPDSICGVFADNVVTAPMAHYSDKQHVIGGAIELNKTAPLPIGWVFFLANEESEFGLRELSVRECCMNLITHSFALEPDNVEAARDRFAQVAEFATVARSYELSFPHNYEMLPDVHALIENCVAHGL